LSQSPLTELLCDFINLVYERNKKFGNQNYLYIKDGDKFDRYSYRFSIKNTKGDYSLEVETLSINDEFILNGFNSCGKKKFESIEDIVDKIKLKDTEKNKGRDKFEKDIKCVIEKSWVNVTTLVSCYYYVKSRVIRSEEEIGYTNDAYDMIFLKIQDLKSILIDFDAILQENPIDYTIYINMRELAKRYFQYLLSKENKTLKVNDHLENKEYKLEDATEELFMSIEQFYKSVELIKYKKNLILQGPPGVGKTFVAKRIAYYMLGEEDRSKIETIQFHPAYSYDDFVQGYKPDAEGLVKSNGVFFNICKLAKDDPNNKYFLIIDEINRGNLSKIFGDTMGLIETDKRGVENSLTLTYAEEGEKFFVPENLYIIGTMNNVDKSIVEFDYAFRRRFSFFDINPSFEENFKSYLKSKGITDELVNKISLEIIELNEELRQEHDDYLGNVLQIGHSYFTPNEYISNEKGWYKNIILYEIKSLLESYYKNYGQSKIDDKLRKLLKVVE
jgi:5-methylcytosine-specific restriction endonuclease McrBC GTP-binding regulatory subunit McrB